MSKGHIGLNPLEPKSFQVKPGEEGRPDRQRVHTCTNIVPEPWQSERPGPRPATNFAGAFQEEHIEAGLNEANGRSQTIGTCPNDHCIKGFHLVHERLDRICRENYTRCSCHVGKKLSGVFFRLYSNEF
jgi:hypothetical protein